MARVDTFLSVILIILSLVYYHQYHHDQYLSVNRRLSSSSGFSVPSFGKIFHSSSHKLKRSRGKEKERISDRNVTVAGSNSGSSSSSSGSGSFSMDNTTGGVVDSHRTVTAPLADQTPILRCNNQTKCIQPLLQLKQHYKVYYW